jgi:hypothetical protein
VNTARNWIMVVFHPFMDVFRDSVELMAVSAMKNLLGSIERSVVAEHDQVTSENDGD